MLNELLSLLSVSLGCGVVIALLLALRPVLVRRFSPRLYYFAWILISLRLFLVNVDLALPQAPLRLEVPQPLVDSAYDHFSDAPADYALGSGGGAVAYTDDGPYYFRHYARYENGAGEQVTIQDGPFFRTVAVGETVTCTPHWPGLLYAAYWTVAVLLFLAALIRYGLFRRRTLRGAVPAAEGELSLLRFTCDRLDVAKAVELYRVPGLPAPLLMGFLHPVILLPPQLPQAALSATLAHELTHLKHRDPGYKLFLTAACALHWFNPLVWLMARQARRDVELYCDYDLLKNKDLADRRAYGRAILEQMTAGAGKPPGLTTGFSGDKREVFDRFRAIMDTTAKRRGRLLLVLVALLALAAGGLVAFRTARTPQPDRALAWVTRLSREDGAVYYPVDWLDKEDLEGEGQLRAAILSGGLDRLGQPSAAPVSRDAVILHHYPNNRTYTYPVLISELPDSGRVHPIGGDGSAPEGMSEGELYELTFDEAGAVTKAVRRSEVRAQERPILALGTVDETLEHVCFQPIQWLGANDPGREAAWWAAYWEQGLDQEELTAPLADGAELFYRPQGGGTYALSPAAIEYSIRQSQAGRLLELSFDREGRVTRLTLRGGVSLDLSAAGLDFTGYCGTLYAQGMSIPMPGGSGVMSVDPCGETGADDDHTRYVLPIAADARIPGELRPFLTGLSSGQYPQLWRFTLTDGAITAVEGVWPAEEGPAHP